MRKLRCLIFMLIMLSSIANAQEASWHEKMKEMTYSPRYFGPNAFPLPEVRGGYLDKKFEVEVRGEYHFYEGDQAKDIYGRLYIPVAEGRAGIEVSYVFIEYYYMTKETAEERHAAGQTWKNGANGDAIFSAYYQLFAKNKWVDLVFEATLKTASGNRIADARYTDAATYWYDVNAGFNLFKSADSKSFLRLQGLVGFYCWMTNSIVNRQNDAYLYSAGICGKYKNLTVQADMVGFRGYMNYGDRPLILRSKLNYEFKNNVLSFRYKHGIKDYLYDTYSLAYIRRF